ncbi:MAG: hypothetical protein HY318_00345, partial [Armatimonadetes bacterium]|nr:hypothetical protein [Armatimonadota bacterium]
MRPFQASMRWTSLLLLLVCISHGAAESTVRKLRGIPDAAATEGEAMTLDKEGIYCWWPGPPIKPGYFEVWARARAVTRAGVLHFVLCDDRPQGKTWQAVSKVKRGAVETGPYREAYCGTFYYDGSFPARVSDWSSGGLMVDWVKLVPVSMKAIRDPDPTWVKQVLAPRFPTPPKIDGTLDEW